MMQAITLKKNENKGSQMGQTKNKILKKLLMIRLPFFSLITGSNVFYLLTTLQFDTRSKAKLLDKAMN